LHFTIAFVMAMVNILPVIETSMQH